MIADFSQAEVQMSFFHWKIHKGKAFFYSELLTTDLVTEYLMRVGSIPMHYIGFLGSSAKVTILIREGVSVSVAGTQVYAVNNNRSSTNTLESLIYKGPAYTGGSIIRSNQSGFGSSHGQAQSGTGGLDDEYVFKTNTDYVLTLTPSSSVDMVLNAVMYEAPVS